MKEKFDRNIFEKCLFFSSNSLTRSLASIADDSFKSMEITPTQGFTLLCVSDMDIHSPSEISQALNMKASTITRFVNRLVELEYLEYEKEGRNVRLDITLLGREKVSEVRKCWSKIYRKMAEILSQDELVSLTQKINSANHKFINDR